MRLPIIALASVVLGACVADADDGLATSAAAVTTADAGGGVTTTVGKTGLQVSTHTTLGIPENASVDDPAHALLVKSQYVISFDSQLRKNPRWTSWELTPTWLGSAARTNLFLPDPELPSTMAQPTDNDYRSSGFERGHLCPSADRTDSPTDNAATFVFTNVVPQTNASNTGTWETLEVEERTLARSNHVFIIAGSLYSTPTKTIGSGVAVPSSMYKIVVVMSGAHPTPAEVTTATRVISVEIPNTTTVTGDYRSYRTSFGALEAKTGFRFLSDVAPAIHDALATHVDSQ